MEIMKYFFEQLTNCTELYDAIHLLNEMISNLFEKASYYHSKLLSHLGKLLHIIFSAFENAPAIVYEEDLLHLFEPVVIKAASCNRQPMRKRAVQFWNNTFGKNQSLTFSNALQDALMNCETPVKAIIGSKQFDTIINEYNEDAQFPDTPSGTLHTSPKLKQKHATSTSPMKVAGSFLQTGKRDDDKSPIKLSLYVKSPSKLRLFSPIAELCPPVHSSKKHSRRKLPIEDFVEINEVPKKSRLLTEHQKEVMREKKVIPLMYNNLDQSQDTSLFLSLTQNSNSQVTKDDISSVEQISRESESNDSGNVDFMKCERTPPSSGVKEVNKTENHVSTLVEMSPSEEEEGDVIPSSQTQDTFSKLCSPFVDNSQSNLVKIAESPEEHLKHVSTFHGLLPRDASKNGEDNIDEQIPAVENQKCHILENNKENSDMLSKAPSEHTSISVMSTHVTEVALIDCGNLLTAKKSGNWLSTSSGGLKSNKKTKSKKTSKHRASPNVNAAPIKDLNDNIKDDVNPDAELVVPNLTPLKRKRKSLSVGKVVTRKKSRSKSVSPKKSYDGEMVAPVLNTDMFDIGENEKVILQTKSATRNSRQTRANRKKSRSPKNRTFQKNNMYNFLTNHDKLKLDIKIEEVEDPLENQSTCINNEDTCSLKEYTCLNNAKTYVKHENKSYTNPNTTPNKDSIESKSENQFACKKDNIPETQHTIASKDLHKDINKHEKEGTVNAQLKVEKTDTKEDLESIFKQQQQKLQQLNTSKSNEYDNNSNTAPLKSNGDDITNDSAALKSNGDDITNDSAVLKLKGDDVTNDSAALKSKRDDNTNDSAALKSNGDDITDNAATSRSNGGDITDNASTLKSNGDDITDNAFTLKSNGVITATLKSNINGINDDSAILKSNENEITNNTGTFNIVENPEDDTKKHNYPSTSTNNTTELPISVTSTYSSPTSLCRSQVKCLPKVMTNMEIQGDLKNPFVNTVGGSPNGIRHIPSPGASPVNGILKKRTCNNQSPSPPFKVSNL